MKLNPRQRWLILGSLLAATIGAGLWLDGETPADDPAGPAERRTRPALESPAAGLPSLVLASNAGEPAEGGEDGDQRVMDEADAVIDPFRPATWYVAPPPPPPQKPKAPLLPFKYLGRIMEDGSVRVFLSDQDRHLIVKVGDVINSSYKVEKISDGQVVFNYLPLKERQVLLTGGV